MKKCAVCESEIKHEWQRKRISGWNSYHIVCYNARKTVELRKEIMKMRKETDQLRKVEKTAEKNSIKI